MNVLNELKTYAGEWQGTNLLYLSQTEPPEASASILTVTLAEKAVQIACTWAYEGTPQNGTLLLHEETPGQVVALWTDTFHTEGKPMRFSAVEGDGPFAFLGSYAAPPGPDWGWRIVFEPGGDKIFSLRMFNITPEGVEEIAVEAEYRR